MMSEKNQQFQDGILSDLKPVLEFYVEKINENLGSDKNKAEQFIKKIECCVQSIKIIEAYN